MKTHLTSLAVLLTLTAGIARADDDRPVVDASKLKEEKSDNAVLPTLYLVGDSTVRIGGKPEGFIGWGERIGPFFNSKKINVVNKAIGGRSSRTYYTEGRWDSVLDNLKKGDFVIIQFGHNDVGQVGDPRNKHRASGKGFDDDTEPDEMADGTIEQVHTFGWYMEQYATTAKAKGATVILCSPIPHKDKWEHGRDFEEYAEWNEKVARKAGVLFFDLTMVITDAYKEVGREKVDTFFADKGTHTSEAGAVFNAECVISGLKSLKGNPLGPFMSDEGKAVNRYKD